MPDDRPNRNRPTRRELRFYCARGLLVLGEDQTPTAADLRRVRRIRRLRRDLGLSYEAIDIVLRLVDCLESAEATRAETRPGVRITVLDR